MRCFDVNLHNKKLDLEWISDKHVTRSNKTTSTVTADMQTNKGNFNVNKNTTTPSPSLHKNTDLELQDGGTNATKHDFKTLFTPSSAGVTCWNSWNNKDSQLLSMCVFVTTVHLALASLVLPQASTSHAEFFYIAVICCYPISIMFTKNSTTQLLACCLHVLSVYDYIRHHGNISKLSTAVYFLYIIFFLTALLLRLNRNLVTSSKIICIVLYVGGMFAVLGLWVFRQNAEHVQAQIEQPISPYYTINANLLCDTTASVTVLLIASFESLL